MKTSSLTNAEKIAIFQRKAQPSCSEDETTEVASARKSSSTTSVAQAESEYSGRPATVTSITQRKAREQADDDQDDPKQAVLETLRQTKAKAQAQAAQDELDRIVGQFTTFKDQMGEYQALFTRGARIDPIPIQSERFQRELRVHLFEQTGRAPNDATLKLITDRMIVKTGDRFRHVYKRVAREGDDILLDLGDEAGQYLRVDPAGWALGNDHACVFKRSDSYGQIGIPDLIQSAPDAFRALEPLLTRVPKARQIHLIAALVTMLDVDADYPIILLVGPEGSAKTTIAQNLAKVIDPPRGLPPSISLKTAADIVAGVQSRHLCIIDNAPRHLGADIEDTLCKVSTGAQDESRRYYTNYDVIAAELHTPIIVTSIQHPFRQRDTRNRTLVFEIEALKSGFRRRADVGDDIDTALGSILGGLLYFASAYLRERDTLLQNETIPHRMVDWAVAGEIIARELGLPAGRFFGSIKSMQRSDAQTYLEGDAVGIGVIRCLRDWAKEAIQADDLPSYSSWQPAGWSAINRPDGTFVIAAKATTLKDRIAPTSSYSYSFSSRPDERLPKTGRAMAEALRRLQGVFQRAGIDCQYAGQSNRFYWTFTCQAKALAAEAFD